MLQTQVSSSKIPNDLLVSITHALINVQRTYLTHMYLVVLSGQLYVPSGKIVFIKAQCGK